MGLFENLFGRKGKKLSEKSKWDTNDNEDWFEHSGEDHDIDDGYCSECDELEEDLDEDVSEDSNDNSSEDSTEQ